MSGRIRRGKRAAIQAARLSSFYSHRVGCVIYKGSRCIVSGYNKKKTHPHLESLEADCYSQHAEFDAIFKLLTKHDVRNTTLFVARLTRTDKVSLAKPCEACQEIIRKFGIEKVYFTDYSGKMVPLENAA